VKIILSNHSNCNEIFYKHSLLIPSFPGPGNGQPPNAVVSMPGMPPMYVPGVPGAVRPPPPQAPSAAAGQPLYYHPQVLFLVKKSCILLYFCYFFKSFPRFLKFEETNV